MYFGFFLLCALSSIFIHSGGYIALWKSVFSSIRNYVNFFRLVEMLFYFFLLIEMSFFLSFGKCEFFLSYSSETFYCLVARFVFVLKSSALFCAVAWVVPYLNQSALES